MALTPVSGPPLVRFLRGVDSSLRETSFAVRLGSSTSFLGLALVFGAAIVAVSVTAAGAFHTTDPLSFIEAGHRFVSRSWLDTYQDPYVQEGPGVIAIYGVSIVSERLLGLSIHTISAVIVGFAFIALLSIAIREIFAERGVVARGTEALALTVAIVGGLAWLAHAPGHFGEGIIPLLWVLAAVQARAGRGMRAGAAIGTGVVLKPWAVMGLPLLLLAGSPRKDILKSAGLAIVIPALAYFPFVAFGDFRAGELSWRSDVGSLASFVTGDLGRFGWQLRVVQAALVIGIASVLAVLWRERIEVVWSLPLLIVCMRLVTDPVLYYYYWLPVALLSLIGAASLSLRVFPLIRPLVLVGVLLLIHPFWFLGGSWLAVWTGGAAVLATVLGGSRAKSASPNESVAIT